MDRRVPPSERNPHLKKVAVETLPDFLEYAGWLLFPCTLVVGPAIEFREYHDWLHRKGHWGAASDVSNASKKAPPGLIRRYARVAWLVLYSSLFCVVHLVVMRYYTIDTTYLSPSWNEKSLLTKFWQLHVLGQGSRGKYFFCWVWAEAACVASGVGFGGYDETTKKPKWDVATNVKPMGVERAATFVEIPKNWNVKTGMWLRHYVYDRCTPAGKRPGFTQLLLTQIVSGVWHGLYAGYWLFFVSSAVFVHGSKGVYRWQKDQKTVPKKMMWALDFPLWVLTTVGLNYLCGAFMLVTYDQCMNAWGSVYFIPHLTVLGMVFFSETVGRAAAASAKKAKKELDAKTL
jgi:lysophospholipid acyltransferase|tara:strand:+ start:241 stop:1275 length:1035 start_codon:yes stop_codon:yes gene_type:complete